MASLITMRQTSSWPPPRGLMPPYRLRSRLLSYDIFPPRFLRFVICPPGELVVGSVIVQRVGFGPVALESAVRVVDVWQRQTDGGQEAGFTYVTLAGHPERGVASFKVRKG
jgi:hypothetical protein